MEHLKYNKKRQKNIGLALSGGGARGFAHLGALKALNEYGIYPEIIAGVSAGSAIGVLYSAGVSIDNILKMFEQCKATDLMDLTLPRDGFFKMDKFKQILDNHLPVKNLDELTIPTYVCATDINNGIPKIFKKGNIVERVSASCSIPIVFKPVNIDGINYIDGGVLRNLPSWAIRSKCNFLIGVNCSPASHYEYKGNLVDIAQRSFELMSKNNTVLDMKMCDMLISTKSIAQHKTFNLENLKEICEGGYKDACKVLETINIKEILESFQANE